MRLSPGISTLILKIKHIKVLYKKCKSSTGLKRLGYTYYKELQRGARWARKNRGTWLCLIWGVFCGAGGGICGKERPTSIICDDSMSRQRIILLEWGRLKMPSLAEIKNSRWVLLSNCKPVKADSTTFPLYDSVTLGSRCQILLKELTLMLRCIRR